MRVRSTQPSLRTIPILLALLASLFFPALAVAQTDENDAARKAYLEKRAAEKASAETTVRDLTARDQGDLSADDCIRLAYAQNELGDNQAALVAVCRVTDDVLAEKKQLELKAICLHNASGSDPAIRIREFAFIDRCLDRKYESEAVWLWRKAAVICRSAVAPPRLTIGDNIGDVERILDREQYEYAFELLERACRLDLDALQARGIAHSFMWPSDFPKLHTEERFVELIKKFEKE